LSAELLAQRARHIADDITAALGRQ